MLGCSYIAILDQLEPLEMAFEKYDMVMGHDNIQNFWPADQREWYVPKHILWVLMLHLDVDMLRAAIWGHENGGVWYDDPKVEIRTSTLGGEEKGAFLTQSVKKGDVVLVYPGRFFSPAMRTQSKGKYSYVFALKEKKFQGLVAYETLH